MLRQEDVLRFLLNRRLIDEEQIVGGTIEVINASRRNHNFKVFNERGPSYFIKQGVGEEKARTVAHEADVYTFVRSFPGADKLRELLAPFCGFDPEQSILILEAARDAQSLIEHHTLTGRCSARLSASLGVAIGTLHRLTRRKEVLEKFGQHYASYIPLALYLYRPDASIFRYASHGAIELIKMVQRSNSLCESLDHMYGSWKTEALIHGDLRWDNCSVFASAFGGRTRKRLRIIDWELAGIGDPAWDVGTVFSEYLGFWIRSAPISGATLPEQFLKFAKYPLEKIQPALRAFWNSYLRAADCRTDADDFLLRAVNYTAARLIQTAFERVQDAAQMTGHAATLVQLSANILSRPREASVLLLGLSLDQS